MPEVCSPTCERLVRAFTRRYMAAIVLLAAAAMCKYALFVVFSHGAARIQSDLDDAGRQRWRTQRIALDLSGLLHTDDPRAYAALAEDLRETVAGMRATHESLLAGGRSGSLAAADIHALRTLYHEAPAALDRRLRAFLDEAERLGALPPGALRAAAPDVEALVERARGVLTSHLDLAVQLYEEACADRHAWQELAEVASVAGIAGVLALVGLAVFRPMARRIREEGARVAAMELRHERAREQGAFTQTLYEALDMADSEEEILRTSETAMAAVSRAHPMELLLADSSDAHLKAAAVNPSQPPPGCVVRSPWACPAVRHGHTIRTPSSDALNACPRLRERDGACSATCVPVSFMGRALGVLHASGPTAAPLDDDAVRRLETLAVQVGNRLGTLRTFAKVELQAATDPLTGLLNRRAMEAEMRRVATSGRPFAVAIADLDHFKRLNDTYGHDAGDRALTVFAQAARECLRGDDPISRHGGEEFVMLLDGMDGATAAGVLDRLRARLAEACAASGGPTFTASFGVAGVSPGADWRAALVQADAALLRAKASGRDRVALAGEELELLAAS